MLSTVPLSANVKHLVILITITAEYSCWIKHTSARLHIETIFDQQKIGEQTHYSLCVNIDVVSTGDIKWVIRTP